MSCSPSSAGRKAVIVDYDKPESYIQRYRNHPCNLKVLPEQHTLRQYRINRREKSAAKAALPKQTKLRLWCEDRLNALLLSSRGSRSHGPPAHATDVLSSLGTSPQAGSEGPGLLSLPVEIHEQIFLHTTARDTACSRLVCTRLNDVISQSKTERHLSTYFVDKELARLRHDVEELKSLEMPTSIDTLMEALHVWTKRRGLFEDTEMSMDSMLKLMSHLFMGRKKGSDLHRSARVWARIATYAIWLHQQFERGRRVRLDQFFSSGLHGGLLDYGECEKLFLSIKNPELQHPKRRLSGQWWYSWKRKDSTIPAARMTPLLPFDFDVYDSGSPEDRREVRQIYEMYLDGTPYAHTTRVTHGRVRLLEYLGLPTLPNEVFCYHLQDEWAQKEVSKILEQLKYASRSDPVRVPLLLKAAILEDLMVF